MNDPHRNYLYSVKTYLIDEYNHCLYEMPHDATVYTSKQRADEYLKTCPPNDSSRVFVLTETEVLHYHTPKSWEFIYEK